MSSIFSYDSLSDTGSVLSSDKFISLAASCSDDCTSNVEKYGCDNVRLECVTCTSSCENSCTKSCTASCTDSCTDSCTKSCTDSCTKSCTDDCTSCEDDCTAACTSCEDDCTATCTTTCTSCQCRAQDNQCTCGGQGGQCKACQDSDQSKCTKVSQSTSYYTGTLALSSDLYDTTTKSSKTIARDTYTKLANFANQCLKACGRTMTVGSVDIDTPADYKEALKYLHNQVMQITSSISLKNISKFKKIESDDFLNIQNYLNHSSIPNTIPCCQTTSYQSCLSAQYNSGTCSDNYQ